MTVLFFGTYDRRRHPRVTVLIEGFEQHGDSVIECNAPLGDSTRERVAMLRRPWLSVLAAVRIAIAWGRLIWKARTVQKPDVVVVGYLGHIDVHLARRLWPTVPVALDHLVFLADTARDRGSRAFLVRWLLQKVDFAAMRAADIIIVDTKEHRDLTPPAFLGRTVILGVGAPQAWFAQPERSATRRLRVVFFGLFTPLQGTKTIGRALGTLADAPIDFLMIGTGQDYEEARAHSGGNRNVTWIDWVEAEQLRRIVSSQDVCLGIFGTSAKSLRVVPNKVFQGAAAGCMIVTSDTPPQRRALGQAGTFVPPGSAELLTRTLRDLQANPELVWEARTACYDLARSRFTPKVIVATLRDTLGANRASVAR